MRFRLSGLAREDLQSILRFSDSQWGIEAGQRYWQVMALAMREVASAPRGPLTRDCSEFAMGLRRLHTWHVAGRVESPRVGRPVHVLYYRVVDRDLVEIVRILHERMDPARNLRG